jgi:hypothetical protein
MTFLPISTAEGRWQRTLFWDVFFLAADFCAATGRGVFTRSYRFRDCQYTEYISMPVLLNHSNQVRYRTEKSLFFSSVAAKFVLEGAASQALYSLNDKEVFGLVR